MCAECVSLCSANTAIAITITHLCAEFYTFVNKSEIYTRNVFAVRETRSEPQRMQSSITSIQCMLQQIPRLIQLVVLSLAHSLSLNYRGNVLHTSVLATFAA